MESTSVLQEKGPPKTTPPFKEGIPEGITEVVGEIPSDQPQPCFQGAEVCSTRGQCPDAG